jgi:integrase
MGALCLFMFGTGARISEALRLVWADVDLARRVALVNNTKIGGEVREAHLPAPVVVALANIPSNRNPMEQVFGLAARDSVRLTWGNVCQRAGIERLTPHCCRHGFATTMLRTGVDVKTVARLGGWKDAATVLRHYAHALEDRTLTDALFGTPVTHPRERGQKTDDEASAYAETPIPSLGRGVPPIELRKPRKQGNGA